MKITVVGAGNVGETIAHLIAFKKLAQEVILVDVVEGVPQGKALDLYEASPIEGYDTKIFGSNSYDQTADSDIIIITAGVARKQNMSRDDLLDINAKIVKNCVNESVKYSPNAIIIVVTNPVDVMTYLTLKESGFNKNKVVGMGGTMDSSRFRTFIAMELGVSVNDVDAMVLGGHGDSMVPLHRLANVAGIPISELLDKATIDRLIQRTRDGGLEIVKLLKTHSAYYAPASATVQIVESIVQDKKRVLACSVLLDGEYNITDTAIGVPVVIGKNGVEEIINIHLNEEEKIALQKSAKDVRIHIDKIN